MSFPKAGDSAAVQLLATNIRNSSEVGPKRPASA